MEKQELYTKLIRIRYNQKVFDIFGGENHQKTFLEVRVNDGKEEYYYPTLKDYIGLNNIYNKPFDGVLHSKKYSFQSKVLIATYAMGLSLMVGQALTPNNLGYRLERNSITYSPPKDSVELIEDEVETLEVRNEASSFSLEDVDPSMYYQDASGIMVYDNKVLTALGIPEVTFDEVRLTLKENQKISPEYKEYMDKFLDLLEAKMPSVDLRVLNSNWKELEYVLDLDKENAVGGTWDLEGKKLHLKEEYIDPVTKEFDEKSLIKDLMHELVHTLNYGKLTVTIPNTSEEIVLYKFFQRTNYGESFSEGFTTILTDYLLSDLNKEEYFLQENPNFASYEITTPICYQILKGMDHYNFYDFVNKDVSYFDQEVTEEGFSNAILVVDTYFETLEDLDEDDIIEVEELDQLIESILKNRIQGEIEKGSSNFKILSIINDIPLSNNELPGSNIDKFEIVKDLLKGRNDGTIYILSDEEINAGLTEEEQIQKGFSTVKINRGENKEVLDISPRMVVVYKEGEGSTLEYHLAYFASDQEYHNTKTDEIINLPLENQVELIQVLPQMDMVIQDNLLKDEDFIKMVEQQLETQQEELKRQEELQAQKQREKDQLKNELDPLITDAISSETGDLGLCRIISENTENIDLAMEILSEYKPDILIQYRNPISHTEGTANTMLALIDDNGARVSNNIDSSYVIYQREDETGITYQLGKLVEENGNSILYDYSGNQIIDNFNLENIYALKEILPEVEKYSIQVKTEFFSSLEFQNLMETFKSEKAL